MAIKGLDRFMGKPIDGALEKLLEGTKIQNAPEPIQPNPNLDFHSASEFWTVGRVPYRNGLYRIDLSKQLLDRGQNHTQDEWSQFSESAKQKGDFYVGNFPLYHALFAALHNLKGDSQIEKDVEAARNFLEKEFHANWLITLTRIKYSKTGKDKVIHNHGMQNCSVVDAEFVGPDEYVEDATNMEPYKALLGTDDKNEINSVYKWLTGRRPYLYRVNSKPDKDREFVAGFVAGSGWAGLGCNWNPSGAGRALGVRAQKI
ncbi:hypothetical protein HY449_04800 [Candidatus Pacearchaeota archaeon]|nr:hypothetical protein [Candidatus Pacearchaeota archaeon]